LGWILAQQQQKFDLLPFERPAEAPDDGIALGCSGAVRTKRFGIKRCVYKHEPHKHLSLQRAGQCVAYFAEPYAGKPRLPPARQGVVR
jgi:hypothetical protein